MDPSPNTPPPPPSVGLSSAAWPWVRPWECEQLEPLPAGNLIWSLHYELHTQAGVDVVRIWTRSTDCHTVSPISEPVALQVPEPSVVSLLLAGALALALLRRKGRYEKPNRAPPPPRGPGRWLRRHGGGG